MSEDPNDGLMTFDLRQNYKEFLKAITLLRIDRVPDRARHYGPAIDRAHMLRSQDEVQMRGQLATFRNTQRYEKHARLVADFEKLPRSIQTHGSAGEEEVGDVLLGKRLPPNDQ